MENDPMVTGIATEDLAYYSSLHLCQLNAWVISVFHDLTGFKKSALLGHELGQHTKLNFISRLPIVVFDMNSRGINLKRETKNIFLFNLVSLLPPVSYRGCNSVNFIQTPKNRIPKYHISVDPTSPNQGRQVPSGSSQIRVLI